MHAARFYDGADELTVEDVDVPTIDAGEVLVDLRAASLCGSDVNYLKGKTETGTTPITLGHEGAGVVEETGDAVEYVSAGDRVLVHYVRSCGHCEPCVQGYDNRCRNRVSIGHHVDGTFAEYIAVPTRSVVPLPEAVPFEVASITGCAVSTAYHAVHRADMSPGDTVVVFGAGGVGLHAIMMADAIGAATVIAVDPSEPQREAAIEYGASVALDPENDDVQGRIAEVTDGCGAHVAVECSGAPDAMSEAVEAINGDIPNESGNVVSVGIQTEPISVGFNDVREGQLRVSGDHTRGELHELIRLIEAGGVDLSRSITDTVSLADVNEAVELAKDPTRRSCRVVLDTT